MYGIRPEPKIVDHGLSATPRPEPSVVALPRDEVPTVRVVGKIAQTAIIRPIENRLQKPITTLCKEPWQFYLTSQIDSHDNCSLCIALATPYSLSGI